MQIKLLQSTLILCLLTTFSCSTDKGSATNTDGLSSMSVDNNEAETYAKYWTKQKRKKIIVDNVTTKFKSKSDTVQLTKNEVALVDVLAGGLWNNKDSVTDSNEEIINVIYDVDRSTSYEIRKWKKGDRSFNGIRINGQYQGWCEWFYRNGNILKEGTLINSKPVGIWEFSSVSGQLDSTVNYRNTDLIYSNLK